LEDYSQSGLALFLADTDSGWPYSSNIASTEAELLCAQYLHPSSIELQWSNIKSQIFLDRELDALDTVWPQSSKSPFKLRENFANYEDTDPRRSHPRLFTLM
jgi:hypothetical protein